MSAKVLGLIQCAAHQQCVYRTSCRRFATVPDKRRAQVKSLEFMNLKPNEALKTKCPMYEHMIEVSTPAPQPVSPATKKKPNADVADELTQAEKLVQLDEHNAKVADKDLEELKDPKLAELVKMVRRANQPRRKRSRE